MVSRRALDRNLAQEKVDIIFYEVVAKGGKRMLRPLKFDVKIPLKLVRAIADNTVIPRFFDTLASDLRQRGVAAGTTVQMRARFNEVHAMVDPALKGTRVICEIAV